MLARPMESPRPQKTPTKPTAPAVLRPGVAGDSFLARHGNTILTVLLVAAAAVLAVRWWNRSAEAARAGVAGQLDSARDSVAQLQSPRLALLAPAELMAQVRIVQANVTGVLSDVINKADDAATKARALVVRGDLNWAMANLPDLPGAATQPSLKVDPPPDDLLRQASDAYTAALDGADHETAAAAHFGLAAIAENRGDWAAARQQLQAVADDKGGVAVLTSAARTQLDNLPTLQQGGYLAPPTEPPSPATAPTTARTTSPASAFIGPMPSRRPATTLPTVAATTLPMTKVPTTLPAVMATPSTVPAGTPTPTTRPAK